MNKAIRFSIALLFLVNYSVFSQKEDQEQDGIYKPSTTSFEQKLIQYKNITFTANKYIITNYITTKESKLVTIYFKITNDSSQDISIDLDNLNLIDDKNNLNRVELVQGLEFNENDKFILEIKANSSKKKKIHFIIKKDDRINKLSYMNKVINLN